MMAQYMLSSAITAANLEVRPPCSDLETVENRVKHIVDAITDV